MRQAVLATAGNMVRLQQGQGPLDTVRDALMYPSVAKANQALVESQARSQGHEVRVVCTWMIEDDADWHAECKCGWSSREMRDSYSCSRFGRVHMWVKSNPPEVVAARLKELDDALGQMLDAERDNELGAVLGYCSHGVNLDQAFCPDGCRV